MYSSMPPKHLGSGTSSGNGGSLNRLYTIAAVVFIILVLGTGYYIEIRWQDLHSKVSLANRSSRQFEKLYRDSVQETSAWRLKFDQERRAAAHQVQTLEDEKITTQKLRERISTLEAQVAALTSSRDKLQEDLEKIVINGQERSMQLESSETLNKELESKVEEMKATLLENEKEQKLQVARAEERHREALEEQQEVIRQYQTQERERRREVKEEEEATAAAAAQLEHHTERNTQRPGGESEKHRSSGSEHAGGETKHLTRPVKKLDRAKKLDKEMMEEMVEELVEEIGSEMGGDTGVEIRSSDHRGHHQAGEKRSRHEGVANQGGHSKQENIQEDETNERSSESTSRKHIEQTNSEMVKDDDEVQKVREVNGIEAISEEESREDESGEEEDGEERSSVEVGEKDRDPMKGTKTATLLQESEESPASLIPKIEEEKEKEEMVEEKEEESKPLHKSVVLDGGESTDHSVVKGTDIRTRSAEDELAIEDTELGVLVQKDNDLEVEGETLDVVARDEGVQNGIGDFTGKPSAKSATTIIPDTNTRAHEMDVKSQEGIESHEVGHGVSSPPKNVRVHSREKSEMR